MEVLLDHGADANRRSRRYGLRFLSAAFRSHLDILRLFIERDAACIDLTDELRRNVLHFAARSGHLLSFESLLSKGIDINSIDVKGNTVLHYAACANSRPIIKYILDHGFATPKKLSGSWSPLHWAYRSASNAVVNLLKTMYSNEEVIHTLHPAGLWTPISIGLYYRNANLRELSQNSLPKVLNMDEGIISNKKAESCGGNTCDECFLVGIPQTLPTSSHANKAEIIFSPRFRCLICFDFDLCLMCKLTGDKSHPLHG